MATTIYNYALTGTVVFPVNFEYLARRFVVVTLKGATEERVLVLNVDYRFTTKNEIQTTLSWGPTQGFETIEIRRVTSATDRLVNFTDGSILRSQDLNISQIQAIHIAEEGRDISNSAIQNNGITWNALGFPIKNVGYPTLATDAATLGYVSDSLAKALRGPDVIAMMPAAGQRANKILAFNGAGDPITVLPQSGSASEVLIELANPTDPLKGAALIGRAGVTVAAVVDLQSAPRRTDLTYLLMSYHRNYNTDSGGRIYWSPTTPKSRHNGGTVISPTVVWNGTEAAHAGFLKGVGETDPTGTGCFIREGKESTSVAEFGTIADWSDALKTGFDNRFAIEACINAVRWTTIPSGDYGVAKTGSMFFDGVHNKTITGDGILHKMGLKGIFSFYRCTNIRIASIWMDGQIVRDELEGGSIVGNNRPTVNYAFAVSFSSCSDCSVRGARVYDFAWDGLVATGAVDPGGLTATQNINIDFSGNYVTTCRGTMIWTKAMLRSGITGNQLVNPETFSQKANAIFAVEWCHDMDISRNFISYCGDNAVGVGEQLNQVVQARNKRIIVKDNIITKTRYHSILIAYAEDSSVTGNIIHNAGMKTAMIGPSVSVVTGAITLLGGAAVPNVNVKVASNIITEPYEHGIYLYDRPGTTLANASEGIELLNNTIHYAGKPVTTSRLASSGITSQLQKPPKISGNMIYDTVGDGMRIFGDASISGNSVSRGTASGINIPSDTLLQNKKLTSAIVDNVILDTQGSGITVAGRDEVTLAGNSATRCGLRALNGATENTAEALGSAGFAFRSVKRVFSSHNIAHGCGSGGMVGQFIQSFRDTNSVLGENGAVFTTASLRAGALIEGATAALVKVICSGTSGDGGTTQLTSIRVVFSAADSVALDVDFTNSGALSGITAKSLINI